MNFTYLKFTFLNTIKKKPIWVTWLLYLFAVSCFLILVPAIGRINTLQLWANTALPICQTFTGMMAAIFTAILAINIFKDVNEEGTELIIISKPISRFKIVLTKFLVFGFFCLVVNLSCVLLTACTILIPTAEKQFYVGLLVSTLIGNAISFAVFGFIAILLTVNVAKVGVIIVNIALSLVFLIYQTLTVFVFKTPLKAMSDYNVGASSYIVLDRKEDGSYNEDRIVAFGPSIPDDQNQKMCSATNWQEMKDFWLNEILPQDPSPVLNATDVASQVALSYMTYGVDKFSTRQAKRMFGVSRYYNYELTSPASPELPNTIENKKTLDWMYTGIIYEVIEIGETTINMAWPSGIGFAGIKPFSSTRIRGYGDKIPVGYVKSKDILATRDVFFEKEDWDKYKESFDLMYDNIYNPSYYKTIEGMDPVLTKSVWNQSQENLAVYYNLVWHTLMNDSFSAIPSEKRLNVNFNINSVNDLNDRFIQYKYYAYLRALDDQHKIFSTVRTERTEEIKARKQALQNYKDYYIDKLLGIDFSETNWYITASQTQDIIPYLDTGVTAPAIDFIVDTTNLLPTAELRADTTFADLLQTIAVFNNTCSNDEHYLFNSLDKPSRSASDEGRTYMVEDSWMPNVNGIFKALSILDPEIEYFPIPLGQNMNYFYYDASPAIKYWVFATVWAIISLCGYAAGVIVYNKYDIK